MGCLPPPSQANCPVVELWLISNTLILLISAVPKRQDTDRPLPPSHSPRIILVEDDQDLREGLAETLRLHGMDVTDVPSGIAFYRASRSRDFDIAILDVHLPDVSGFELARELSGNRRMGIVMLTARAGLQDRKQGYHEGADLYMTKPVDAEELLLAVSNLVRRLREEQVVPSEPETGTQRSWQVDRPKSRLISPDGRHTALTGREVMLLEEFAKASGARISRNELSVRMGYGPPGPDNRSLDVVIHRLQSKAAKAGIPLPLHNVQSVGICFGAPLEIL